MIYSGADLIRTANQQQERIERLHVASEVAPLEKPAKTGSSLDEETRGALLRFARFINKDGKKPPQKKAQPRSTNPYVAAEARRERFHDCGQQLDIYI